MASVTSYFYGDFPLLKERWDSFGLRKDAVEIEASGKPVQLFYRIISDRLKIGQDVYVSPVELQFYAVEQRIFKAIASDYLYNQQPELIPRFLETFSEAALKTARLFCELYPGRDIVISGLSPQEWLFDPKVSESRKMDVIVELLLLKISEYNPAAVELGQLFNTSQLKSSTMYDELMDKLGSILDDAPPYKSLGLSLKDILLKPLKVVPHSLYGQLKWIQSSWGFLIHSQIADDLLDAFAESEIEWRRNSSHSDPPPAPVLEFCPKTDDYYPEYEAFTQDTNWMPNVVLLAKMVYVWLGQLSKEYGKEIKTLDQIPDKELDKLSKRGFTGLWLIGVWERSSASQKIKRFCGNPEAISSAYSLYDYSIAKDLGGESALLDLKERALKRGIRLASDMVPNHTGIYSRWILEHPDWFVQLDYPPYPTYTFNGPDLSDSPDISINIEDGYWDRRDAAVVFKHYDHRSGKTRFIYHGNDGTSTPWNDTAQLNYLIPEVREAAVNTISYVASMFPIIRFDAAMTLAKKHYQRLWFPQPGHGGVASRNAYGLSREEFDSSMPDEFWRTVVDTLAERSPDTLLLAEAFWLMEGYFVRTLGMHRVYNSAFMNMLKMEENAKYRQTIKNVLEFEPQILQRFVNFMNNPDEKSAAEQFGKQGKYFGACILLSTMPGLPMFGHGQLEGFHEKYGMEYMKAYWDEPVDEPLLKEHERIIFPLLKRRRLFSGADNFNLFDAASEGNVNEDIFIYSNISGSERSLVMYHNKFSVCDAYIGMSAPKPLSHGYDVFLKSVSVGEALCLNGDGRHYYVFTNLIDGLEYIRNGRDFHDGSLRFSFSEYQSYIFMNFREIYDDDFGTFGKLCHSLSGAGAISIDEDVKLVRYESAHTIMLKILDNAVAILAMEAVEGVFSEETLAVLFNEFEKLLDSLDKSGAGIKTAAALATLKSLSETFCSIAIVEEKSSLKLQLLITAMILFSMESQEIIDVTLSQESIAIKYGFIRLFEQWASSESALKSDIFGDLTPYELSILLNIVLENLQFIQNVSSDEESLSKFFDDKKIARFIFRHESDGKEWFNKERWEGLVETVSAFSKLIQKETSASDRKETFEKLILAAEAGGYSVSETVENYYENKF